MAASSSADLPAAMKAFVLQETGEISRESVPLKLQELPVPEPGANDILLQVGACGVCHTELDEIEGRVHARLPVIPGHQVVGQVVKTGPAANRFEPGERVGVAWIYSACGTCRYCRENRENLCAEFRGTGKDADGGYAQFMLVHEGFAFPFPAGLTDIEAAPLLCAGAIGYRSLNLTGMADGRNLGLTGFGGSGHLVLLMARHLFPSAKVHVFARSPEQRQFALKLGAAWAGDSRDRSPEPLQAIIDTTPAWQPVISALENLAPGGRLVINAIRKESHDQESLLELDYARHLWQEKEIKSVANITRSDIASFLKLAAQMKIRPHIDVYPFEEANQALTDLKAGNIRGAKVLQVA